MRRIFSGIALALLLVIALDRTSDNPRSVIWSDAEGYYKYLPGLFILKDFHLLDAGSVWPYFNEKGEFVNKYSCGVAYFQAPFFLASYLMHLLTVKPDIDDYYNSAYARAMTVSGVVAGFLGLLLLWKTLRRSFSLSATAWTVLSVFLGTNLFHYTTKEMGISHVYSFFLFSALIYTLPLYLRKPNILQSLILGVILGWIVLIRPTNAIVFLLLLGYDVYSWDAFKERIGFFMSNLRSIVFIGIAAFLMWIPQLLYWKEMTGQWIYYSYTSEQFIYWNQPKIAAVLFDVQNGLFLYSPMVLLMLSGLIPAWKLGRAHAPVISLLFALATYLFASWWAWWFGGAFGHRSYVEYYAILAFPLAYLLNLAFNCKRKIWGLLIRIVLALLIAFSVRLSYLYTTLPGPWDGEGWRWNWDKYLWVLKHLI
jgi:hypothetical protein